MERLNWRDYLFLGSLCLWLFVDIAFASIEPEFDHSSTTIIVHWYDTEIELQVDLDDYELAGLSECEHRPDFDTSFCELWLVEPTDLDDGYNFDTIGHECYHAFKGSFHDGE